MDIQTLAQKVNSATLSDPVQVRDVMRDFVIHFATLQGQDPSVLDKATFSLETRAVNLNIHDHKLVKNFLCDLLAHFTPETIAEAPPPDGGGADSGETT